MASQSQQQWVQTRIAHIYGVTNVIILIIGRPIGILRHLWLISVISGIFLLLSLFGFLNPIFLKWELILGSNKNHFSLHKEEDREGEAESSIWHSGQQAWTSILTCYKNFHKESCDEFCEASWIWTLNLFWTNSPPNKFHMWSKQQSLGRSEIKSVMLDILDPLSKFEFRIWRNINMILDNTYFL